MKSTPAWEKASEEFLHEELEYVVVKDWSGAEQSMHLLRTELEGRATFLVETGQAGQAFPPVEDKAIDLPKLLDHVSFTNGFTAQNPLPRLSNCYLAASADEARSLAEAHPGRYFLLPDGQCYSGRLLTGGRKKSSGPLVLKRELREYAAQLKAQEQLLTAKTAEQESVQKETQTLESDLERLRQQQQSAEKEAVSLDHDLRPRERRNKSREFQGFRRPPGTWSASDGKKNEPMRSARKTRRLWSKRTRKRGSREQALEASREQLDGLQSDAQRIGEEHALLRSQLAALEERHRGIEIRPHASRKSSQRDDRTP